MDDRCHSAAAQGWQLGNRGDIIGVGLIKAHVESDDCAMTVCVHVCIYKMSTLYMTQITSISLYLEIQWFCMNTLFWTTEKTVIKPSNLFMTEHYKWSEALVQLCVKATNGSICCMQRQQFLSQSVIITLILPTLKAAVRIQKHIDVVVNMSLLLSVLFSLCLSKKNNQVSALTALKRKISPEELYLL